MAIPGFPNYFLTRGPWGPNARESICNHILAILLIRDRWLFYAACRYSHFNHSGSGKCCKYQAPRGWNGVLMQCPDQENGR